MCVCVSVCVCVRVCACACMHVCACGGASAAAPCSTEVARWILPATHTRAHVANSGHSTSGLCFRSDSCL